MNKRDLLLTSTLIAASLLMSGCGPKYLKTNASIDPKTHVGTVIGAGEGKEFGFINHAKLLNNAINYPLQLSAEKTLESGMKYFSILDPVEISNDGPAGVGTAEEYVNKCSTNSFAESLAYLKNPCKIARGSLQYPAGGILKIKMYDDSDRPKNILTYDAMAVIQYFKTTESFQEAH